MDPWQAAYVGGVIFLAGLIRGYSGFGFAMVCALALAHVFPPSRITPMVICLDLVSSAWLLTQVRQWVDWKSLKLICLGAVLTLPLGTHALSVIPANPMRILICLTILVSCLALLGQKQRPAAGPSVTFGAGLCSGFLTGAAALGGPPVILFYYASDRAVEVSRASMIVFFLLADGLALVSGLFYGLVDSKAVTLSAALLLPLGAGIWLGHRLFTRYANAAAFRKQVMLFLLFFSALSLFRFILFPGS